jgi:hypothetical protein
MNGIRNGHELIYLSRQLTRMVQRGGQSFGLRRAAFEDNIFFNTRDLEELKAIYPGLTLPKTGRVRLGMTAHQNHCYSGTSMRRRVLGF